MRGDWDRIAFRRLAGVFDRGEQQENVFHSLDGNVLLDDVQLFAESTVPTVLDTHRSMTIASAIDLAGALDLAHQSTYADLTAYPWLGELKRTIESIDPRRFEPTDSRFSAVAHLQDHLKEELAPINGVHVRAYGMYERYLTLSAEVSSDDEFRQFLRVARSGGRWSHDWEAQAFASPEAFADAFAGRSTSSLGGHLGVPDMQVVIRGGARAIVYLRTIAELLNQYSDLERMGLGIVAHATWLHGCRAMREHFVLWRDASLLWDLPSRDLISEDEWPSSNESSLSSAEEPMWVVETALEPVISGRDGWTRATDVPRSSRASSSVEKEPLGVSRRPRPAPPSAP
jgi:hypothetical protein